jgi:hypothetical protein
VSHHTQGGTGISCRALEGSGRIRFVFGERGKTILISPELAERLLGERSAFRSKVVQTRNFYTHLGRPRTRARAGDQNRSLPNSSDGPTCYLDFMRCLKSPTHALIELPPNSADLYRSVASKAGSSCPLRNTFI